MASARIRTGCFAVSSKEMFLNWSATKKLFQFRAVTDCFVFCDFKFKRLVNRAVTKLTNERAARSWNSCFYFKLTELQATSTSTSAQVLHEKTLKKETVRHTCRSVESLVFRPRTRGMNKPQRMNSFSTFPTFCWLCLIRVWASSLLTRGAEKEVPSSALFLTLSTWSLL